MFSCKGGAWGLRIPGERATIRADVVVVAAAVARDGARPQTDIRKRRVHGIRGTSRRRGLQ